MRVLALLSLCTLALAPDTAAAEMGRTRRVGPWNVAALFEKGVFQSCTMARPETRTSPGFGVVRGRDTLTLALFSSKWKLDKGTTYPVTLGAGGATEELQATVGSATAVAIDLTGRDSFVAGLSRASTLEVRAAASTLRLPLDQSGAALAKLNDCFAAETQTASNPFGAPAPANPAQSANPFKRPAPPAAPKPAEPKVVESKPAETKPAASSQQADEAYAKARADCEQDEDAERQIAGCTTVIESGREVTAVQGIAASNRGFGYLKKGDTQRAIASYTEAIRLYPEYANAHWGRADVHMEREAWDGAIADYTAALKLDPKDDYSLQNRGRAHLKKAAWDAAITDLDEALRIKPNEAGVLNLRALGHLRKGDPDRALADADDAIRIKPDFALAYVTRGETLAARGDPAAALADYDSALRLSPDLASAAEGRGKAQAALASQGAGASKGTSAEERRALRAIALVGIAPKACRYDPVFSTVADIAGWSGLSAETLEAEPYAGLRLKETERAEAELRADETGFCERVWAEYGSEGSRVRALVSR
jgi:tetratricopeptide (TPR) repeat protein